MSGGNILQSLFDAFFFPIYGEVFPPYNPCVLFSWKVAFCLTINLFNSFVSVNRSDEFPVPSGRISDP